MFENLIIWLSHFAIYLDAPDLSQCLNNSLPVEYGSTLVVKCYIPGNPDPDVKCDLVGENNVMLHSEGKYVYSLQVNYWKMLTLKDRFYFVFSSSVFTWLFTWVLTFRKKQNCLYILFKAARLDKTRPFIYFQLGKWINYWGKYRNSTFKFFKRLNEKF